MSKAEQFTVRELQARIRSIDAESQRGFGQIAALAKVAFTALETEAGSVDSESMAQVFACILEKAHEAEDAINAMAEDAGCNYVDAAYNRRIGARATAVSTGGETRGIKS